MKNQLCLFSIIVIFLIIPNSLTSSQITTDNRDVDYFTVNVTLTDFPYFLINGTIVLSGEGYSTTTNSFNYIGDPLDFQYKFGEGGTLTITVSFAYNGCNYSATRLIKNPQNASVYNITIDDYVIGDCY